MPLDEMLDLAAGGDAPADPAEVEAASIIDVITIDSLDDLVPGDRNRCVPIEGAECVSIPGEPPQAQRAASRGRDFDKHRCKQLLLKTGGDVECAEHLNPLNRYPRYVSEAIRIEVPPILQQRYNMPRWREKAAGRLKQPDWLRRGRNTVVLGENKCYAALELTERTVYGAFRILSFFGQLLDYTTKVVASRRGGARYLVRYDFCGSIPGWAANLIAVGLAQTQADGFRAVPNVGGGSARYVTKPICWEDRNGVPIAAATASAYSCFVRGGQRPNGVMAGWDCLGTFYDTCTGSE